MSATPTSSEAGRPRDETIDGKVIQATLRHLGTRGWSKLSIDRVALAAGVGKASIYLRWHSKENLVLAAIEHLGPNPSDFNTGTLEGDLAALIQRLIEMYRSDEGTVTQRLFIEVDFPPALVELLEKHRTDQVKLWRQVIRTAIANKWLVEDTPIGFVLNLLHGTAWSYVSSAPSRAIDEQLRLSDIAFTKELVATIIDRYGNSENSSDRE